jgi:hypothetical protein
MEMTFKLRKSATWRGDDQVLVYAGLFLVCALVSALGGGTLGLLSFIPAVIAAEVLARLPGDRIRNRRES